MAHRLIVRSGERGIALVLVMTVVLALTIVATPFVLSMLLQERSGTLARYESQADYGADGAKNYALWRLMLGVDPVERRFPAISGGTYFYDTASEIDVRIDDAYLTKAAQVLNPRGAIWGISVQDEQGKLNVRTAPLAAIQNLQRMTSSAAINQKDYFTQYSGRDASWIFPQRIRGMGQILPAQQNAFTSGLCVDRPELFGPQTRVRATKSGVTQPFYATIGGQYLASGFPLATSPAIPGAYADGILEVEWRHPININTARRETLIAVWEGLHIYNDPTSQVGRPDANRLVNFFHGKDIPRIEIFFALLAQTGLQPNQMGAVALNAVCPTAALLDGTGTVPFCFKTYDVYTVEGLSSINNPAGAEVAGRGFREVVSVSPPNLLTRYAESQLDFDLMSMGAALAFPQNNNLKSTFYGIYPFGHRITTFPNMMPLGLPVPTPSGAPQGMSEVTLKPQQKKGKGGNEALVQLSASRDMRGLSQFGHNLQNWPNQDPRDHFDDSQEGKRLQSAVQTYPWGQVLSYAYDVKNPPPPGQQNPDIGAGGLELWVRFDSIQSPLQIFDIREQDPAQSSPDKDYCNRLTLRIENGELILTAADSTIGNASQNDPIDNGAAEIRQPFTPVQDTWYHFGAYWKGTRYGQLALLVDGFAHPQQKFNHVNPGGQKVMTKLASALTQQSTSFSLQDDSWLPQYLTPLLIGTEIILYDKSAGTMFRGARGTLAQAHPQGAVVSIWGYSSKVEVGNVNVNFGGNWPQFTLPYDRIYRGGGTVEYNFGMNPQATVAGDKSDNANPPNWFVDATENQVGVISPAITDFPDQGYIEIDQEVIYYTARSMGGVGGGMPPSTSKFTGCTRGQQGTTAAQHKSGARVRMWGVPVTNYTNYPSPTIIAIDDEWFGPVWKDPTRNNFWIPTVVNGNPLPLHRGNGVFGSAPGAHSAGTKVIPTFLCKESDPQQPQGRLNLGRNDWVTLVDTSNNKEERRVRMAGPPPPPPPPQPPPGSPYSLQNAAQIAALDDFVTRDYVADQLYTRVLKFPSGELIGLQWILQANPNFSIGSLDGTIDEVKCFAAWKPNLKAANPLGATDTSFGMNQPGFIPRQGGLLKMGDEYIGYTQEANQTVSGVKRGWLCSTGEVHDMGEDVFELNFIPVAALANDVSATDANIALLEPLSGDPKKYTKGYVLLDSEMLRFEWNGGDGKNLGMPVRWDGTTGLYRGMFGTTAQSHMAAQSLVYGMPYRFSDTYKAQEFDNTMAYFQWSTKMDLAGWKSFRIDQDVFPADPNVVLHALVRVDGKGEFYDRPAVSDMTLLFESITGTGQINRVGHLNDAGQLDVRFYTEYKQGSFDATAPWNTMSWKKTTRVKQIQVDYDRPVQVLYHEDR